MNSWGDLPEWQRARAERLHEICTWIEAQPQRMDAYKQAVEKWANKPLENGSKKQRLLRISEGTLIREFPRWQREGRKQTVFVLGYKPPGLTTVPGQLVAEIRRRLTIPGKQFASAVYNDLKREWKDGCSVPGLGTWKEWWSSVHEGQSLPDTVPDFPIAASTLRRYQPDRLTRALGSRGIATAREMITHLTRDTSRLRPCEVYVLDDKEFDFHVLDDVFGSWKLARPVGYLMMDVGPRYIAGVVVRPGKATAFDVDALIANTLADHGMGNGYATHILFERGTVACSAAREQFLQANFPGQLFIHRTGMIQGYAHASAYKEAPTGKPCSKGMIEAVMYKLDIMLAKLPGQLGNRYQNMPAEAEARLKSADDLAALEQLTGLRFDSPILRLSHFNVILRAAIDQYNHDPNHSFQGFHKILQMEVRPGVWEDVPQLQGGPNAAAD